MAVRGPSLAVMLRRVAALSCPACGRGRVYRRYFLRADGCRACGWRYERGEGHWVGGSEIHMFASFGLSAFVAIPLLVAFDCSGPAIAAAVGAHVFFSLVFFRFSRALFLGIDYYFDPEPPPDDRDQDAGGPPPRFPPPRGRLGAARRSRLLLRRRRRRRELEKVGA